MLGEILSIINRGENISTEFKEARDSCPKSAFETVCAFLNRAGGNLFFGISDKGEIIGINKERKEQIKKDFVTSINNIQILSPVYYLNVDEYEIEGRVILHIKIPESSDVHRYKSKIFDRNEDGDIDVTLNTHAVSNMYLRKQKGYSENIVHTNVTMDDFRKDTIEKARKLATLHNSQHPWRDMSDKELFQSLG